MASYENNHTHEKARVVEENPKTVTLVLTTGPDQGTRIHIPHAELSNHWHRT